MAGEPSNSGTRSVWFERFVNVAVAAIVGLVGAVGAYLWLPAKDRADFQLKYINLALAILQTTEEQDPALRKWAVEILNAHSPNGVKMETDGEKNPLIGTARKPASTTLPPTGTSRVEQISLLQTQGVKALLEKNHAAALSSFAAAYKIWPIYRTTDEIVEYLRRVTPTSDADWSKLYRTISKCDLFGVESATLVRLAAVAGYPDVAAMTRSIDNSQCAKS